MGNDVPAADKIDFAAVTIVVAYSAESSVDVDAAANEEAVEVKRALDGFVDNTRANATTSSRVEPTAGADKSVGDALGDRVGDSVGVPEGVVEVELERDGVVVGVLASLPVPETDSVDDGDGVTDDDDEGVAVPVTLGVGVSLGDELRERDDVGDAVSEAVIVPVRDIDGVGDGDVEGDAVIVGVREAVCDGD